jgi:hypothetical protein
MIGSTATVTVDGQQYTGTVYHVRDNGWVNVQTDEDGHIASGPLFEEEPPCRAVREPLEAPTVITHVA